MSDDAPTAGYPACENLLLDVADGCLTVTLHRPGRRNAIVPAMMAELRATFERAAGDPAVRIVILRGAGGHFTAGGDLDVMANQPPAPQHGEPDPLHARYRGMGRAMVALDAMPQPVVAMLQGAAVGGGTAMACCSDIVIAHADAKLGMPEPRAGFFPALVLPFVLRRIGEFRFRELAMTSRVFDGREAQAYGIVHHVCTDAAAMEAKLVEVLAEIRRGAPAALAEIKRLVRLARHRSDEETLDDAAPALADMLRGPDVAAGIAAFKAKRLPPWAE